MNGSHHTFFIFPGGAWCAGLSLLEPQLYIIPFPQPHDKPHERRVLSVSTEKPWISSLRWWRDSWPPISGLKEILNPFGLSQMLSKVVWLSYIFISQQWIGWEGLQLKEAMTKHDRWHLGLSLLRASLPPQDESTFIPSNCERALRGRSARRIRKGFKSFNSMSVVTETCKKRDHKWGSWSGAREASVVGRVLILGVQHLDLCGVIKHCCEKEHRRKEHRVPLVW